MCCDISFKSLKREARSNNTLTPILRIALLGDTATQFLATAIKGMGHMRGFCVELFEAEYNQVERQVMDPTSELHTFNPEITIVFQSTHKLLVNYGKADTQAKASLANDRLEFVDTLCKTVPGKIICYNYPEIDDVVYGSFANQVEHSFTYQLRKLNFGLMNLAANNPDFYICDLSSIQNKIGRDVMFQTSVYVSTEMVLSIDSLPLVASRTWDIICAMKGRIKKCLILDLDNTLWGGVIGDDGMENIQLGHGLGIGKAFTEFQLWIKKLKERGIILAVCSKNTESVAKEPFMEHPDMVLRLDDIAVFMANWDTKVANIRQIQSILNIGFDSMVFLDDNPFERNMVREAIPEICVPELPEDPGDYLEFLYSENLFETVSYSAGDKDRTRQYQVEAQRVEQRKTFTSESDFLKSLNMLSTVEGFTSFNIPRVAQLSQRSNQFNLRTIRYTDGDIERMEADDNYKCLSFTLEDKFGDNGLICVVILKKENAADLFVDTWFMSCRVLKRGMEAFTLNTIVEYAKANGFKRIIGEYIPTAKNAMVAEHYTGLGFRALHDGSRKLYAIDVESYQPKECFISKK